MIYLMIPIGTQPNHVSGTEAESADGHSIKVMQSLRCQLVSPVNK